MSTDRELLIKAKHGNIVSVSVILEVCILICHNSNEIRYGANRKGTWSHLIVTQKRSKL